MFGHHAAKLLFTDTDSLAYAIETPDITKALMPLMDDLDTSNYPQTHALYSEKNKKVVGKFKDESASREMKCFCGLLPKLYCIKMKADGKESSKAKGVGRSTLKRSTFDDYLHTLKSGKILRKTGRKISSYRHHLVTEAIDKTRWLYLPTMTKDTFWMME